MLVAMSLVPSLAQQTATSPAAHADSDGVAAGITRQQADAILAELQQIRQLLEKQTALLANGRSTASPTGAFPNEKVRMPVDSSWHSLGRDDAPLVLVEFSDYQCPFCRRFHSETFSELKKNYIDTGKLRFISRDLPLDFHSFARKAAVAALCAGEHGKYWEMRDALITNSAGLNETAITSTAGSLGLSASEFSACVESKKFDSAIQKDSADAAALQINGTPTFVVGKISDGNLDGVRLVGAQPYGQFDQLMQSLLKERMGEGAPRDPTHKLSGVEGHD